MELASGPLLAVPVPALLLLILCIVGILNSGKINETLALLVGLIISYVLLAEYGPTPFTEDAQMAQTSIRAIPFLENLVGFSGAPRITELFKQDFHAFLRQLLNLWTLSVITSTILTVSKPLADSCHSLPSVLAFSLPWLVRYTACVFGMWGYEYLQVYLLSGVPENIITAIAYLVFLAMALMLLSPLMEFLLLSAHVTENPVVSALSKFVKEYKMGGVLQTAFFSTFFLILLTMVLQETGAIEALVP